MRVMEQAGPVPPRDVSPEQFGVHEEIIENENLVFFFLGQYIEAPYHLTRKGVKIYVNDVMVSERRWPGDFYLAEDPPLPRGLTRESSFADLEKGDPLGEDWNRLKVRYLYSNFSNQEAKQRYVRAYLDLPFVQQVTITPDPVFPSLPIFNAVAFNGDKFSGAMDYTADSQPVSSKFMAKILQENVEKWRERLDQQGLLWGWTGHPPGSPAWAAVPEIVEILQSDAQASAKAKQLTPLLYNRIPFSDSDLRESLEKRLAPTLSNFRENQHVKTVLNDREVYRKLQLNRQAEELRREQEEKQRQNQKRKVIPKFPFRPGERLGLHRWGFGFSQRETLDLFPTSSSVGSA